MQGELSLGKFIVLPGSHRVARLLLPAAPVTRPAATGNASTFWQFAHALWRGSRKMSEVPPGFVGRFEQEPNSLDEYASNITHAIEAHSQVHFSDKKLDRLPRFDSKALTKQTFLGEVVRAGLPCIITDFVRDWDPSVWNSIDAITEVWRPLPPQNTTTLLPSAGDQIRLRACPGLR